MLNSEVIKHLFVIDRPLMTQTFKYYEKLCTSEQNSFLHNQKVEGGKVRK